MNMSKRIDSASKFILASPEACYAAFTKPNAVEKWLPPMNMTAEILHFDFRESGCYRMRLTYKNPDGGKGKTTESSDDVDVTFIKLDKGKSIEQAVTFKSGDPGYSGIMRMTWTFQKFKHGTLVMVRAEDVPPKIKAEDHRIGLSSTLDNLASFLECTDGLAR